MGKNDFRNGWFQGIAKNPYLRGGHCLEIWPKYGQ